MKKVVIVGGGYAGCELAKKLDGLAEVTLIDLKESFVHTPAVIRALTDTSLMDELIIPYNSFLKNGRIVKGVATKIENDRVLLGNGESVEADFIIVATGSDYATPFKHTDEGVKHFRDRQGLWANSLKEAKRISIVGAGPVGSELAGEIAYAFLEKEVHLISREEALFPRYKKALGKQLYEQFEALGVKLHLNQTVTNLQSAIEPYHGSIEFDGGGGVASDLVIPVIGSRPKAALLKDINDVRFDRDGRALHDGWMRPSPSRKNLFAIGDVVASGDAMTIVSVSRQTPWLSKILASVIQGRDIEKSKKYKPWPLAPILLPLGPKNGASILPIGKDGSVAGPFMTRQLKGKSLFLPKYQKFFDAKNRVRSE